MKRRVGGSTVSSERGGTVGRLLAAARGERARWLCALPLLLVAAAVFLFSEPPDIRAEPPSAGGSAETAESSPPAADPLPPEPTKVEGLHQLLKGLLGPPAAGADPPSAARASAVVEREHVSAAEPGKGRQNADRKPGARRQDRTASTAGQVRHTVSVSESGRVDLHVSNMPVVEVLRLIAEQTRQNVVSSRNVNAVVSADLYNVSLDEALDAILTANGLAYRQSGPFIHVYTMEELDAVRKSERRIVTRVFRLRYITAKDAATIVTSMLSENGRVAVTPQSAEGLGSSTGAGGGGGGGGAGGGGNTAGAAHANPDTLIVTDYAERLSEIGAVLERLDVRPKQVLVEATILRAQLNEDNALGIDFTTVAGIDFTELSSVSPGAQSLTTGIVPPDKLRETTLTGRTDFAGTVPSGGFTFGIIKDQVAVFIRALEQITDLAVLANPKILALNKQRGEVIVGRRDGYVTTTVTETTAVQTVEFLETGTRLLFRPFILDDETIRMEIHPEDSTGGITAANLPFKQTTEVTTNILVRSGHTILIGGLFRELNNTTRGQVPILGNIPVAGALFRQTSDAVTREEIIILLTVRIVAGDAEEQAGRQLNQEVERYRIGQRRSAQWFGRERISQTHYRWALEHLSRGDVGAALWDVVLAIRLNPRHIQAFHLREQLMRRRAWEEDGSIIRHTVADLMARDAGVDGPVFGRPAPPFDLPAGWNGPGGFDDGAKESAPPMEPAGPEGSSPEQAEGGA